MKILKSLSLKKLKVYYSADAKKLILDLMKPLLWLKLLDPMNAKSELWSETRELKLNIANNYNFILLSKLNQDSKLLPLLVNLSVSTTQKLKDPTTQMILKMMTKVN